MTTRIRLDLWRSSLLAGLGLVALACGETAASAEDPAMVCHPSDASQPDGWSQCDEGYLHREEAVACQAPEADAAPAPAKNSQCTSNSDCVDAPYGSCVQQQSPIGLTNSCVYGCVTDSDCGANRICQCGSPSVCITATCKTDSDCATGYLCSTEATACGSVALHCQTPKDTCFGEADCPDGSSCITVGDHRECSQAPGCSIGRPFLVDAAVRVAPLAARDDWRDRVTAPDSNELSALECARLAAYYGRAAQLEHASIAAFARFALQLLSLGAPPQLVQDATSAMADETAHAQLCFELASRYAGGTLGPGPLVIDGAMTPTFLPEVVQLVIEEGCIGETVAALEAEEAAAHATEPSIRQAMQRIAADERRHADLAWRFLKWALEQDDSLRDQVQATFSSASAGANDTLHSSKASASELRLLGHGLLRTEMSERLRSRALKEVVGPCARALLGAMRTRAA